jgi:hypothetical protein
MAGQGRQGEIEVAGVMLVVIDAKAEGAAVRKGKRRHAEPHAATLLDRGAKRLQDLRAEHALVDRRDDLGKPQPAELPLLSARAAVGHRRQRVLRAAGAEPVHVEGDLVRRYSTAGPAARIEQHEPSLRLAVGAVPAGNPLLRKRQPQPGRDVVEQQRQERQLNFGHDDDLVNPTGRENVPA